MSLGGCLDFWVLVPDFQHMVVSFFLSFFLYVSISSHLIEVEFWILQNYSPKKLICSLPSRIRRIPCLLSNNGYYQSLTYKYGTICHFYMYFPIYQWIEHFACLLAICISSMIAFAHFVKPVSISGYLICREFVYFGYNDYCL